MAAGSGFEMTAHDPGTALACARDPELMIHPTGSRILIVDHDTVTTELIQFMMQNSATECEITSVLTPDAALRLAATQRFDLYVLDYRLAAMTGIELCRALRRMDAHTPIMFFTGEAHERERQEAMQAGADAYLVKPNDIHRLTETVNGLLSRRAPAAIRETPPEGDDSGRST